METFRRTIKEIKDTLRGDREREKWLNEIETEIHNLIKEIKDTLSGDRKRKREREKWLNEIKTEIYNLTHPPPKYSEWGDGKMTPDNCWRAVGLALMIDDPNGREKNLKDIAMKAIKDGMENYAVEIIQQYIKTPETQKAVTLEAIDKLKPLAAHWPEIKTFEAMNQLIELLPETDEEKSKRKEEIIKEFESKNEIKAAAFATAVFVQEPERTKRLKKHINQLIKNDELLSAKEVVRLLPPGEERYEKAGELILAFAGEGRIEDAKETIYENRGAFSDEERQELEEKLKEVGEKRGEFVKKLREVDEVIERANNRRNPPKFVFV